MGLFRFAPFSERTSKMQLTVRSVESYQLNLSGDESVAQLHAQIAEREGAEEVCLYVNGRPLDMEDMELNAGDLADCAIEVSMPLKGGKVHGSLARAGKVRGQTPKVEAQEKKKKKTGRAKRRIQYNRGFVNVVATFGRKKGPNSNS